MRQLLERRLLLLLTIMIMVWAYGWGQRNNEPQLLKISEDEDFLNLRGEGTDRGYTSGLNIELYYRKKAEPKFPTSWLMRISDKADNLYAFGFSQIMNTPNNISGKEIQYNDIPYSAVAAFSNLLVSADSMRKQKLTTSISLGVIGRYAFGEQFQCWFHNVINYQPPEGWDNQVKSDIIINYSLQYEKLIVMPCPNLEITGNAGCNLGTFTNDINAGFQIRAGKFTDYFSNSTFDKRRGPANEQKKLRLFVYMKMNAFAVMNNATLQGGFFTHDSSPYTIPKDSINRAILRCEYGIVMVRKRFGISYCEKMNTAAFKGSYAQQTGNLTLFFGL